MSEERLPGVTDPAAWRLKGAPGPPLRRAAVVALAPAIVLAVGLEKDPEVVATLTLAALLSGFIAFDAPARTRAIWITAMAPVAGLAVAIGALTSEPAALAAVAMGAGGAVVGYSWAISPRAYVAALSCLLGLLVVQGLFPGAAEAPELAALGLAGVLLQAAVAVAASVSWDRRREAIDMLAGMRTARASLISEFNLSTTTARHAIRFGLALAVGVAAYNVIDLREHGYWIPLTVLFVLRPDSAETIVRLGMRAAGSIVGVLLGTVLAELAGTEPIAVAIVVWVAVAVCYALLALEYAVFTAAITVAAIVIAHAFGEPAFAAAGERVIGTVVGIAIAALAVVSLWPPSARSAASRARPAPAEP